MERAGVMFCLFVLLVASTGCSRSTETESSATVKGSASENKDEPGQDAAAEGPAQAVFAFLEAVRTGDDAEANEMLTPLAREKTAELDMVVAPPGSETASFEVGEVELLPPEDADDKEELAHVACTWTDVDEQGEPRSDNIIWALRREEEGWRIAGMATKIFDDLPPLLLNFEDPQDMQRKQEWAEEEMERRARKKADEIADDAEESTDPDDADDVAEKEMSADEPADEPRQEAREVKPKAKAKRR